MKIHQPIHQGIGRRTRLATCLGIALALGAGSALAASPDVMQQATAQAAPHTMLTHGAVSGQTSPSASTTLSQGAAASTSQTAATITVNNCNDSGGGSLRAAVDFASSGDTIDMSGLSCSTIKLNSSIVTSLDSLTLKGKPDAGKYGSPTIDAQGNDWPLRHTGSGTLTVIKLGIQNGSHTLSGATSSGGCVSSTGNVQLTDSSVKYCTTKNTGSGTARGGGVFADGNVTLTHSIVRDNTALNSASGMARGGGVYAGGNVTIEKDSAIRANTAEAEGGGSAKGGGVYSTGVLAIEAGRQGSSQVADNVASSVSGTAMGGGLYAGDDANIKYAQIIDNTAESTSSSASAGGLAVTNGTLVTKYTTVAGNEARSTNSISVSGGIRADGPVSIDRTTISGNTAQRIGGLSMIGNAATDDLKITNSTISGNRATKSKFGAGIYVSQDASIENTTITGNIESNPNNEKFGAGLSVKSGTNVYLSSTIISGNKLKWGGGIIEPTDVGTSSSGGSGGTLTGNHNFITVSSLIVPADTIGSWTEAGLAELADNGGMTKTHALEPGSQAIDTGKANAESTDQRGPGFERVIGPYADIGAFEVGGGDVIFADGFE